MRSEIVGLLPVDKPAGPTSHDVTASVRRTLSVRRVGHSGTLDPFASGLLLLCVGWAARLAEYLQDLTKIYRGVIRLGERTDTDDPTGKVIERSEAWRSLAERQIEAAVEAQVGSIQQTPPAFSAKKVAGRRAYAVARRGVTPDLKAEPVTIERVTIDEIALPCIRFEIECSSGTYVRAVARDVGSALGVGAHLAELRRTRIGAFSVESALRLDGELSAEAIVGRLMPPELAVKNLAQAQLDPEGFAAFVQGRPVEWAGGTDDLPVAVFSNGRLVAIGEFRGGVLWPKKVFPSAPGSLT